MGGLSKQLDHRTFIIVVESKVVARLGEVDVVFVVHEAEWDPFGPLYGLPRGVRTHGMRQSAQQLKTEPVIGMNTMINKWKQANSVA
jgi:hypothetical protein